MSDLPDLKPLVVLVLALCSSCGGASEAEPEPGRSIILVSLDTLRADHTSLYGYERDTTPRLVQLASEAVTFDGAVTVAPWTLVSHMSMLTGLYPDQHGVRGGRDRLASQVPLLAEQLKAEGYQTIGLYYEGWIHERHGFDRGFEVFEPHANVEEAGVHLAEWLPRLDRDRPFFLFLHLFDAHMRGLDRKDSTLYEPPAPFDAEFLPDARARLAGQHLPRAFRRGERLDASSIEALVALYDGGVRYLDAEFGELVDDWRARGMLDQALLLVTSDHGEALGQRAGELKGHGSMWEEGLRVPLVLRAPDGTGAGTRRPERVTIVDVVPTLREWAGLEADPLLPGYSLLGSVPEQRVVVAQFAPYDAWYQGGWKYRENTSNGKGELYELSTDPGERSPIFKFQEPYPETVAGMKAAREAELGARAHVRSAPEQAPAMEQEQVSQLQAVGYAGEDEGESRDEDGRR